MVMSFWQNINKCIFSCRPVSVTAITLLAVLVLPAAAQGLNFQGCGTCHQAALKADNSSSYQHPPFKKRQCAACHALAAKQASPAGRAGRQKIDWLAESFIRDTDQGFLVPGGRLGKTLVVELYGAADTFSIHEIAVPPGSRIVAAKDSGRPPAISGLKVLKLQRGILLSATIGWHTDSLTYAQVRYGIKGLSSLAGPSRWLGRGHEVVLYGLQPDKTYRFTAISQDIFGHRRTSTPMTFSTAIPGKDTLQDNPPKPPQAGLKGGIVSCSFHRFGSDYLIELKLKQPASIHLGSIGKVARCQPDDEAHAGLSCGMESATKACLKCHRAHVDLISHSPTPQGLGIGLEYPTLPGGRVTCTTCHNPHGSDYAYYRRKPSRNPLCANCHLWGFLAGNKKTVGTNRPHALKLSEIPKKG